MFILIFILVRLGAEKSIEHGNFDLLILKAAQLPWELLFVAFVLDYLICFEGIWLNRTKKAVIV